MTRFARAKGSKASNERLPNEATPWHVMKQQLVETPSREGDTKEKPKSAKELLKEAEAQEQSSSAGKVSGNWAKFEDVPRKKKEAQNKVLKHKKQKAESSKQNVKSKRSTDVLNESVNSNSDISLNETPTQSKNKAGQNRGGTVVEMMDTDAVQEGIGKGSNDGKKTALKSKMKKGNSVKNVNVPEKKESNAGGEINNSDNAVILSKSQKRRLRRKNENLNNGLPNKLIKHNDKVSTEDGQPPEHSQITQNTNFFNKTNDRPNNQDNLKRRQMPPQNGTVKRKLAKVRDDKEHKRRKPDDGAVKMVINGIEVEIVKYDGFPVRKEDAERLKELRQTMVMKGIPKSEIDAAMKLERRKSEKALARVRKFVCFHCRKSGHNLSDCPELANEQSGTGICFKCGSTEHTHFECKVVKKMEFGFATCFICREQGHIAKQCPDNPKGIYPQGGACKVCGDVTHLKKDCPDLAKEKEEATVTVDKIADNTLECLEEEAAQKPKDQGGKLTKHKVIKF